LESISRSCSIRWASLPPVSLVHGRDKLPFGMVPGGQA
jgi:hypothetical protein